MRVDLVVVLNTNLLGLMLLWRKDDACGALTRNKTVFPPFASLK